MFEGLIAAKFANKMFEKDVFKTIRMHSLFGAIILAIPDFGLGTLWFIGILWHMYSSICNKVGISFSKHFWSLVGVGIFVNIIIACVIDIVFSFLFFLEGFIIYFQFYMSGKLFVDSLKSLNFESDNKKDSQIELPHIEQHQAVSPTAQELSYRQPEKPVVVSDNIAQSHNEEAKEMVRCSICGEEVEKGTHICPYCNEPLIEVHYVPCPVCGEMIPSNSEFCPECDEYVELNKNE